RRLVAGPARLCSSLQRSQSDARTAPVPQLRDGERPGPDRRLESGVLAGALGASSAGVSRGTGPAAGTSSRSTTCVGVSALSALRTSACAHVDLTDARSVLPPGGHGGHPTSYIRAEPDFHGFVGFVILPRTAYVHRVLGRAEPCQGGLRKLPLRN